MDVLELRLRTRRLQDSLAALTRAQEKLRRSNKALSVFAGQVSHDLRTPLTAIMASTELLGQEDSVRADEWAVEGSGCSVWFELPAEGAGPTPALQECLKRARRQALQETRRGALDQATGRAEPARKSAGPHDRPHARVARKRRRQPETPHP